MTGKLLGHKEAVASLRTLKNSMQRKILRKAVRAGTIPYRKALKSGSSVPKQTGALRRSIGTTVKQKGGTVTGRVGARRGFELTAAVKPKGKFSTGKKAVAGATRTVRRKPSRYLHLANKKHNFMASLEQQSRPKVKADFLRKLRQETAAEVAKLRARGRR